MRCFFFPFGYKGCSGIKPSKKPGFVKVDPYYIIKVQIRISEGFIFLDFSIANAIMRAYAEIYFMSVSPLYPVDVYVVGHGHS